MFVKHNFADQYVHCTLYRGQLDNGQDGNGYLVAGVDTIADMYLDTSLDMEMENNTGVFITSSDLPLDPLYLDVGGVVELDTGSTASKVQVIHNMLPDIEGQFKLHLSTINVTKTLAIGYCVPASADIEVFSSGFQPFAKNACISGVSG